MGDRCIDGRLMRHKPFPDDPDYEHDVGECPECEGVGCERIERAGDDSYARGFDEAIEVAVKKLDALFSDEIESLDEGLMTDADLSDRDRVEMCAQSKAADVWRERFPTPIRALKRRIVVTAEGCGTHGSPELDADAAKLIAQGADPGPTMEDLNNE
jgi:hypothetical protein